MDRAEQVTLEIVRKHVYEHFEPGKQSLSEMEPQLFADIAAALRASQPQWRTDMESAPRDGRRIIAWCRHPNWQYAKTDEERAEWEGPVFAHWTQHNGGGWVWHGHAGTFMAWMPDVPPPPVQETEGG